MKPELQKWHNLTLAYYNAQMFDYLIHPYNIISESSKNYTFEDENGQELVPMRGYFAMKDVDNKKTKYFIEEQYYEELPIRVIETKEIYFKDNARTKSILLQPIHIQPFRIKLQKMWDSDKEFFDMIAPFEHSHPDQWTLAKLIAIIGYIGKTFTCNCSSSEFGKSSIYLLLDAITKKCPVFQPRSVPGILAQITSDGNMIFDEVHETAAEVKACMENFSLQVAGNSPIYINGAMKSANTKPKYDVAQQSITFLYNIYSNYSNPEKQFWDNIWSNSKAMDSRFLKLKFEGKLLEEFDKDFDIPKIADENKMFYVNIAKHLLYLKQLKISNSNQSKWLRDNVNLTGRHKIIYDEILWILDLYSESQAEFDRFVNLLNQSITGYKEMIPQEGLPITQSTTTTLTQFPISTEELIVELSPDKKILRFIKEHPDCSAEDIVNELKYKNVDLLLDLMSKNGEIFQVKPDCWRIL